MLIFLFFTTFIAAVVAQCQTQPPNCANYPSNYFINNPSDCRAYWLCLNPTSQAIAGLCPEGYNFDQANQLCNHPYNFPCQLPTPCPQPTTTTRPLTTRKV